MDTKAGDAQGAWEPLGQQLQPPELPLSSPPGILPWEQPRASRTMNPQLAPAPDFPAFRGISLPAGERREQP